MRSTALLIPNHGNAVKVIPRRVGKGVRRGKLRRDLFRRSENSVAEAFARETRGSLGCVVAYLARGI